MYSQLSVPVALEHAWHGRSMFLPAEAAEVFGGLVEGALEAAEKCLMTYVMT
ncbi:MAG: monoamine oxidase [Candidatus Paceibacteria bacterium]